MKYQPSVLIVGNFLSNHIGSRFVCEELAERMLIAGWSVVTTSNKPGKIVRLLDMVKTVLTRRKDYMVATIDVFSGPSFFWAEVVAFFLCRLGKPFVLTLRGGNLPDFAQRWSWRVFRLFRSAGAVAAPSRYLQHQMKVYRPDIILIPNPIDISNYPFRCRNDLRPTLVWLRAFHEIYNPTLAIRVAELLIPQFPHFHLTMIGPDKRDGSLQKTQQLAIQFGLNDFVDFPGSVSKNEVPLWLNKSDIFINTTNYDNTPISVLEAMACGLCIVSTKVGGISYLLEDGKDALLVPPDNPEATASAIRRILTEPDLAEKLSINARKKVEEFDWSVVLPQWEALFEGLINQ